MTTSQVNRFKKLLEAKREDLLRQIHLRRELLGIDQASDPMDQVRSIADREFVICSVDRMRATLRLVEGALAEIRERTFGVCAQCGGKIPTQRLEAVPWSPYCVSCQELAERQQRELEVAKFAAPYAMAS